MYYQGQAPAERERPGVLMAGVMTVFGTVALTLGTTMALVLSYQWVTVKMAAETYSSSNQDFADLLRSNMIIVIAFYAVISIVLAVGAILTMRQQNAGRILVWVGGGVLSVVNLCCGLSFAAIVTMVSDIAAQSSSYDGSPAPDAPTTELWMATIFTFTAVVAAIVAMILLAQRSVGLWIKGNPQVAPGGFAVPMAGTPMPGSPVAYPQPPQPYQAPPPQQQYPPQYGPGSYGDQYGPGQQPYNGGDQYGPGNPTSGPPNQPGW
ncbi:hypothetical protein [Phytomonospora endophytica]|uniref:MARVEL domain-containing protein n=1 Tax=Phytomonospora endophytica TaxID=714109 RepID=A0A841FTC8_9ACTN|nr:hypothetical protein [Phytomonospora endophytica]MBB6039054.1 hypothetical protein [Phytomonospora endophytica]GIG71483.1 hypothetical protein Pen01_77780 [Phytomonospora endophytica]